MKLISFLFKSSPGIIILAILAGVISGISTTVLLGLTSMSLSDLKSITPFHVKLFIGLCIVVPIMRFISETLLMRIGQYAVFDQRLRLSRRILAAPLRQLEKVGAHRLMAALTDDVMIISTAVLIIPLTAINVAVVLGCLIYLGWLSGSMLMLVLGFMVLGIISYQLPLAKAISWMRRARETEDALFKDFRAMTEGTKELKLHRRRREAFISRSLTENSAVYRHQNTIGQSIFIAAASWGQILFFVVIGLLLFVVTGLRETSTQELTAYVIVLLYMMTPLQVTLNGLPALGRAGVSLKKLQDLGLSLDAEPTGSLLNDGVESALAWKKLEFVGVTHSYRREGEDDTFTVGPLDLTLYQGEMVFVIGGNGSGKTSFAKLLLGLYAPEQGTIRLDGQDITDESRDSYRQLFSAVHADFYLFERLLGLESAELDATARGYLEQLQLSDKVVVKDEVLSTLELSQGQRKRLALLTAYLENRPIYVFDEWAADQDPQFKDLFYHQLLPDLKARGKTIIVISHDDRFYNVADRIIKLEYGQIVSDAYVTEPALPTPLKSRQIESAVRAVEVPASQGVGHQD
ncbi:MAG TPA: cyclic peptide export ABC transporter [Pyrinomonadaceae bacterium]|nr:cyclic peptide export ABC transporter [Pyrinomonadaceae bacterium]